MHDPVEHRREHDARDHEHDQAGVERIKAREQLARRGAELRIDRTHSAEQHRRVQVRVNPRHSLEVPVSGHADRQRTGDNKDGNTGMPQDTPQELGARGEGSVSAFVH